MREIEVSFSHHQDIRISVLIFLCQKVLLRGMMKYRILISTEFDFHQERKAELERREKEEEEREKEETRREEEFSKVDFMMKW